MQLLKEVGREHFSGVLWMLSAVLVREFIKAYRKAQQAAGFVRRESCVRETKPDCQCNGI